MTGIVDYNAGNVRSVSHALEVLGFPFILSKNKNDFEKCDRLIFPGVGDAHYAMEQLKKTGFDTFLKDWANEQKPLLGICLGSQIIFDYSEEGNTECLGILKGSIKKFETLWKEANICDKSLKVPHMGWNDLTYVNGLSKIMDGIKEHSDFYFVHSYVIDVQDKNIIKAYADYGVKVPAIVESGSVIAFQFHPEKSGKVGMQILSNFCKKEL